MAYLSNQVTPGVFNVWSALDRDIHRQKRKLIGPAVNDRSMRAFEPTMSEQVDSLVRVVAQSQGRPIDMSWRCNYLGMDVVSLLAFGFPLNSQTDEQYRFLSDKMAPNNRRLNAVMQIPTIARYRLQVPINMIWQRSRQPVFDLLELMIKKRTVQPTDAHHDLWSFIAESMKADENKDLPARDLWMEAIFFIVAGTHAPPYLLPLFSSLSYFILTCFDRCNRGRHNSDRYGRRAILHLAASALLRQASQRDPLCVPERGRNWRTQAGGLHLPPGLHRRDAAHVPAAPGAAVAQAGRGRGGRGQAAARD